MNRLVARLGVGDRGEVEDAPALLILIGGVLFVIAAVLFIFGQTATTNSQVQAAAYAAARDLSLSTATAPTTMLTARATTAARQSLTGNVDCSRLAVTIDTAGLRTPLGTPGTVSATVSCTFRYRTIQLPGFPTTGTIVKTASSPTDPYRER